MSNRVSTLLLISSLLFCTCDMPDAKSEESLKTDLGTYGTLFPIEEVDLKQLIQTQLQALNWHEIEQQWIKKTQSDFNRWPRTALPTAKKTQCVYLNPSVRLKQSIQIGKTLFLKKGHVINPLNYITPHHILLFINADDPLQRQLACHLKKDPKQAYRVILVQGHLQKFKQQINRDCHLLIQAYYASYPLIERFHIRQLPSLLSVSRKAPSKYLMLLSLSPPYHFNGHEEETQCKQP